MLEGLEAVEVNVKNVTRTSYSFRWDSDYFKKEFLADEAIFSDWVELNKIALIRSGSTPPNRDENLKEGIILLKTNDIRNNILSVLDKENFFYIDTVTDNLMHSTRLASKDILINIVGATTDVIGRSTFVTESIGRANITQAMAFCRLYDKRWLPEFLFAFVLSKYSNKQTRRIARQTGQFNMNLIELGSFRVPLTGLIFQEKIKNVIEQSEITLYSSKKLYSKAEDILLTELGLKDWEPTDQSATQKNFSDFLSSGRLDAEYYQLKYDELLSHLEQYDTKPLSSIVAISKSIEPGSEAYQDNGTPFIRVANLSKFGLSDTDIFLDKMDYAATIRPQKDTILLSKDGSVGIAYKVEQDLDVITSGAILHLNIFNKEFMPDYLTLVLNSIIVKMQAERDAGGSIIQHWKPSEIEQVIIPKLSKDIQTKITEKIRESYALKAESKRLLDLAKTAVEVAIEQGEEKAMELLIN